MTGKTTVLLLALLFLQTVSFASSRGDAGGNELQDVCDEVERVCTNSSQNVNECADVDMVYCPDNATCHDTPTSYCCTCLPGFRVPKGQGKNEQRVFCGTGQCVDDNECLNKTFCGPNATCQNTIGSYNCTCRPGYARQSVAAGPCLDFNECLNKTDCGPNATCQNTIGSYNCKCRPGYAKQSAAAGPCMDIDECRDSGPSLCGFNATCRNTAGSFWCQCPPGYSNYGNEGTPCLELKCHQFTGPGAASEESNGGLAHILAQMKKSCLEMSQPDSSGNQTTGPTVLLNSIFNMTEDFLSDNQTGGVAVSALLSAVEDAIKFIGPQLSQNQTSINTSQTEAQIAVWKERTPPSGLVRLNNTNASLEADWTTALGNGSYPGFVVAALVSYKSLENVLNRSFEQIPSPADSGGRTPRYQLFSKVVSAVVSNPDTRHLERAVNFTLRHLEVLDGSTEASFTCAYWKAAVGGASEEGGGAWSTDGCSRVSSSPSHTVCSCNHLSSFAVLMALYPMEHTFGLMLLTRLGLVLSLVCLALCILTFAFVRPIRGTRTTIHLHLCICLFMADLVFLTGISQTQPQGGCRLVAGLLHLFFLGAFSWMLLEGVQLYRMVVLVFNAAVRKRYLCAVGYGVPLLIVTVSALSRPTGYGTDQYCWLSTQDGLVWSFFGPVCLVIGLNAFIFSVTVWKLAQKFSSLNPDLTHLRKIRAFTVTAIAQLCVLGLMWLSGVFLFNPGALGAAYIFTILNSLQGALIFVLNCLLSKQVRDEYAKFLPCVCAQPKEKYSGFSNTNRSSQSQSAPSTTGSNI